jgi:hypothetical protein
MKPTRQQLGLDTALTDVSTAYIQSATNYISGKIFPKVDVMLQAGRYKTYDKGDMLRVETKPRAPGTRLAQGGYNTDWGNYFCDVAGLGLPITDQALANEVAPTNLFNDGTAYLTQQNLMYRDLITLNAFYKTGVWASDWTPTTKWGTAGADPIVDMTAQIEVISARTGMPSSGMTVTLSADTWAKLKNHPVIIERVKAGGTNGNPAMGLLSALAMLLEVKEVLVARAVYNSAVEGATASVSYIATANAALITYAPPTPSLLTPSAGYMFNWAGLEGIGSEGTRMSRYWDEKTKSYALEIESAIQPNLVSVDCGVFLHTLYA